MTSPVRWIIYASRSGDSKRCQVGEGHSSAVAADMRGVRHLADLLAVGVAVTRGSAFTGAPSKAITIRPSSTGSFCAQPDNPAAGRMWMETGSRIKMMIRKERVSFGGTWIMVLRYHPTLQRLFPRGLQVFGMPCFTLYISR